MAEHRVAVVVFCTVEAEEPVHPGDARVLAEIAVKEALTAQSKGECLRVPLSHEDVPAVRVQQVRDLVQASYGGYLGLNPTDRAYPREEHPGE